MRRNQQRRRPGRTSQRGRKTAVWCPSNQMREGFQGRREQLSNTDNGSGKKELGSDMKVRGSI